MKRSSSNRIILAFLFVGLVFTTGCSWDKTEVVAPPENVSFSTDIIPIFTANCSITGCHSSGSIAPDLTSANAYAQLFSLALVDTTDPSGSTLYQRMSSTSSPMPPAGGLASPKVDLVLAWIEQGAKNN